MELFFNSNAEQNIEDLEFDLFESAHIAKSKRKKIGSIINFTDGRGNLYQGEIKKIKPQVMTGCSLVQNIPFPEKELIMAVGFIRPNRLDFLIEKATEIGINKFILFSSDHSNYFTDNIERFNKIARQAIKQSLRYYLPEIETEKEFKSVINQNKYADLKIIAEKESGIKLSEINQKAGQKNIRKIIFIVGPEGGLSEKEINLSKKSGFTSVSLGDYRLRSETAAVVLSSFFRMYI